MTKIIIENSELESSTGWESSRFAHTNNAAEAGIGPREDRPRKGGVDSQQQVRDSLAKKGNGIGKKETI